MSKLLGKITAVEHAYDFFFPMSEMEENKFFYTIMLTASKVCSGSCVRKQTFRQKNGKILEWVCFPLMRTRRYFRAQTAALTCTADSLSGGMEGRKYLFSIFKFRKAAEFDTYPPTLCGKTSTGSNQKVLHVGFEYELLGTGRNSLL